MLTTTDTNAGSVIKEMVLDAPADKVWAALTDKKKMKEWYFDIPDFEPVVGKEFSFIGEDEECRQFVHLCKVMEVIPGKKLTHSWRYEGYEGDSFVTWELTAEGNQTRLKLTHTGLDTFPAKTFFDKSNFNAGWTAIMGTNLPNYLSKS